MADATDRMRKWRASATQDIARETISLFHPAFSQDWHLVNNYPDSFSAIVRGEAVTFLPHPFEVVLPETTASGRFEMQINLFNTGEVMREIRAAGAARVQGIECEFNQYFEDETASEYTLGPLKLTRIAAKAEGISATGEWLDFLNLQFPRMIYDLNRFPGLDR